MHDLHNTTRAMRGISPIAIGTTGTGQTGRVIDRQGYNGVEFLFSYGAITATNAVFTVVVREGDVTGTLTSVADGDLIGTELLAGVAATTPRADNVSKNVVKRVGYKGNKRYVQAQMRSTITAGTIISCEALLHSPQVMPTPNP